MEHYTRVLGLPVTERQRVGFLNELEKFKQNVEDHRRISAELSALLKALHGLNDESRLNRKNVSSLRLKLNLTAVRLGLEPIPDQAGPGQDRV